MKIKLNVSDILIFQQIFSHVLSAFNLQPQISITDTHKGFKLIMSAYYIECIVEKADWQHKEWLWVGFETIYVNQLAKWETQTESIAQAETTQLLHMAIVEPYCFFSNFAAYFLQCLAYVSVLIFLTAFPNLLHHSMPELNVYTERNYWFDRKYDQFTYIMFYLCHFKIINYKWIRIENRNNHM